MASTSLAGGKLENRPFSQADHRQQAAQPSAKSKALESHNRHQKIFRQSLNERLPLPARMPRTGPRARNHSDNQARDVLPHIRRPSRGPMRGASGSRRKTPATARGNQKTQFCQTERIGRRRGVFFAIPSPSNIAA